MNSGTFPHLRSNRVASCGCVVFYIDPFSPGKNLGFGLLTPLVRFGEIPSLVQQFFLCRGVDVFIMNQSYSVVVRLACFIDNYVTFWNCSNNNSQFIACLIRMSMGGRVDDQPGRSSVYIDKMFEKLPLLSTVVLRADKAPFKGK